MEWGWFGLDCVNANVFGISEEFLTGAQALFLFNSISADTDIGLY